MAYNTTDIAVSEPSPIVQGLAGETIYPGNLCVIDADDADTYILMTIAGLQSVQGPVLVASVNIWEGGTLDTPYLADKMMYLRWQRPGDVAYYRMIAADSAAKGNFLTNVNGYAHVDVLPNLCSMIALETVAAAAGDHMIKCVRY